ncbi:MAG: hypothetical protein H6726_30490 [Sandaracinaceae bacterium]|nr:hypothetical protein [Myxococcales bacterium]MCB9662008.1 hypothetical protein [Sandaracinaceae bacterium]
MRQATYHIVDEPTRGPLERVVVNPLWPFLALMVAGSLVGGTWLALNAFAMGSATRRREVAALVAILVGMLVLIVGISVLHRAEVFPTWTLPYVRIGVRVARMLPAYFVFTWQSRSFALFTYVGGEVRNGLWFLLAIFFLSTSALVESGPIARFLFAL